MIDRQSRERAAELVGKFRAGTASNDEIFDRWPHSSDAALSQVHLHLWYAIDDSQTYILKPGNRTDALEGLLRRVEVFLRSDQEYSWPRVAEASVSSIALALLTLGASRLLSAGERRRFRRAGDIEAWPFTCKSDLLGAGDTPSDQARVQRRGAPR